MRHDKCNPGTDWQFYARARKTRSKALAHPVMAGNRFFATAKGRRKIFHIQDADGFKPLKRALISGLFSRLPAVAQNSFF
ncbi:hypothetical protein [Mesorhizobium carmichaelinearum]|uniref:hypothetical protein n=1 Tax=Mesorhizobium carmichaelinearum TaxID=1208188 RepID=UPI00117F2DE1|nr:hypothetical protein [Mesorhizobium carmichaelinearum]